MRRVCFAGVAYVLDEAAKAQLYEVLEQIISQENHLEFWYAGCYDGFETLALEYIQRIRKAYPSCKIEIVAVMDPLKYDHPALEGIPKETIKEQGSRWVLSRGWSLHLVWRVNPSNMKTDLLLIAGRLIDG